MPDYSHNSSRNRGGLRPCNHTRCHTKTYGDSDAHRYAHAHAHSNLPHRVLLGP